MKLTIQGLSELRARLERLRPDEIIAAALADQAERLAQTIRDSLSEPQGAGEHDKPQLRTGALRDSIEVTASGLEAAIGSNDPAAAPQEMGTARIPPRPFLAPAAAQMGESIAHAVTQKLVSALRGQVDDHVDAKMSAETRPASAPAVIVAQRRTYPSPTSNKPSSQAMIRSSNADSTNASPNAPEASRQSVKWTSTVDDYTARSLGMTRRQLGRMIHRLKGGTGLRGDDDLLIHIPSGDVMFNGEFIGNLFDE